MSYKLSKMCGFFHNCNEYIITKWELGNDEIYTIEEDYAFAQPPNEYVLTSNDKIKTLINNIGNKSEVVELNRDGYKYALLGYKSTKKHQKLIMLQFETNPYEDIIDEKILKNNYIKKSFEEIFPEELLI